MASLIMIVRHGVGEDRLEPAADLDADLALVGRDDEEDTVVLLLSADAPMASKLIAKVLDGEALQRGQSHDHDLVRALVLEGLELGFKLGPVVAFSRSASSTTRPVSCG